MKQSHFIIVVLTILFTFAIGAHIVAAKTLLDNFSGATLDAGKWKSENWDDGNTGTNAALTDFVREISNGKLVSIIGVESGRGRNGAALKDPATVHTIQADVTVVKATIGNDPNVRAQARLAGTFYNSQADPGTTGDVWACVRIIEEGNGLEAEYIIEEALAEDWSNYNVWKDTIASGLSYNQAYTLKIFYDAGNHEFTFTVEGEGSATVTNATLPVNFRPTENPWKGLNTGIDNAVSGVNFISVLFDDVYVNDALYDQFDDAPFDLTLWNNYELSRGVVDGKLHLNVQTEDQRRTSSIRPKNQKTNYLEASFLVESGAQIPVGRSGLARLGGYFYNNSRDGSAGLPYDGEIGDVWVTNRIIVDDNNQLSAFCSVWASDEPDGWDSDAPNIFREDFKTAIDFDKAYTLSIEYTGSAFIFKLNDETFQYDITGKQYPVSTGQLRIIQSRVYAEDGESGHIKVQVDDVYVEGDDSTGTSGTTGGGGGGGGCFISTTRQ